MARWICALMTSALVVLASGCARYNMAAVREQVALGRYDESLARLDAMSPDDPSLPYLYERGLIAHYANRFDESNTAFEIAGLRSEDLYTLSLSREATSLLTSDTVRDYAGTRYERLLAHYYSALNYVYAGMPDDVLVEVRRASRLLLRYADEDSTFSYAGTAFMAYIGGVLYEWAGELNDAYISYRWAERAYREYESRLGVTMPDDVGRSLVRLAHALGFSNDEERYVQLYGALSPPAPGAGELVLIYESGFVPPKQEQNILLPILKSDSPDERHIASFATTLAGRRDLVVEDAQLDYLLRIAVPSYGSNRPRFADVAVTVDDVERRGVLAEDVEAVARATFASEQGKILLRTAARGVLKYMAHRRAKKESVLAGWAVNALNVATERADTRSWETLPNRIHVVRMSLPDGAHDIALTFLSRDGAPLATETLPGVRVRANRITVLNYRTFE